MKIPRAAIIAVMVTVLATLGSLVQRQFAQSEPVSQAQLVLDDQTQRVDLDGLEFERKLVKGAPFSATLTGRSHPIRFGWKYSHTHCYIFNLP